MPELDNALPGSSQLSGGESATPTLEPGQSAGGNEGTPPGPAAPASSSSQGGEPSGQLSGPDASGQAGGQPSTGWKSVRDAAYGMFGLDLRQMPSDEAALRHLIGQATQAQQAQAYANRYLQHAQAFEQYLSQQQAAQQPAKPSFWNPPEFNPAWRGLVTKDPDTGEMRLAPGAPPDILPKMLAYDQYRRDFADRLLSDPVTTLKPFVEDVAKEIAQGMIGQTMGSYQDQVWTDNFIQQNSTWLHARDDKGQVVMDPFSRKPLLSPVGERFRSYVEQLHQSGVTNIRIQEQQARALVERDVAMAQLAQIQAGQQNQQIKSNFLAQNNLRQPNQSGTLVPAPGQPPPAGQGLSLAQRLSQRFREAGVTDADFAGAR